ncbi:MAG: type II toxin-antitoxin system RelE/ParE family toxin [Cytophagales bacterium]|nr:type II toxin-antitoxin system RelE/ParE family toxin [Cytophagales bacterium]
MKKRKILWSDKAKNFLKHHHGYIKIDSPTAAKAVKSEIIREVKRLANFPERFQLDEFYPNNPEHSEIF